MKRRIADFLWSHATAIAAVFLIGFLSLVGFVGWTWMTVTRRFDSARMWDLPSRIYSDAAPILPGQSVPRAFLEPKLNYLGYHEVDHAPEQAGDYRYVDGDLELYLQDFRYPDVDFHGMPVRIEMRGSAVRRIIRLDDGSAVRGIRLEPELVTSIFGDVMEDRVPVPLDKVAIDLINALVATEDRTFYEHEGISFRGIVRAAMKDLTSRSLGSGGSTLTQQLVKNLFLTPERTFRRKAIEAVMAVILEARYPKDEILEAYVNEAYFGQNGSVQLVGVERAAQVYFGKHASALSLAEAATLAGVIRSPNYYSPLRHPERARQRRNVVLAGMRDTGMIDTETFERAVAEELTVNKYPRSIRSAPYFVDLVLKELRETYPETQLKTEGLRILTTLDTMMQRAAEQSLTEGLERLKKDYPKIRRKTEWPEGVVLTIEPGSGYVKALVGGRDYRSSQFNRAYQAKRQPGSLFKPFVYASVMDPARGDKAWTPATILQDSPITVEMGKTRWEPKNYDGEFHGSIPLRIALEKSYNIPAVRAGIDAGMSNVIRFASSVGMQSRLEPYPSISLGSFEVTPLEIAYAYSVFANEGVKSEPLTILAVSTRDGRILENRVTKMSRVAPASVCYVLDDILKGVFDQGTAASSRSLGFRKAFAGKTGTTNDNRDAWFVGYSPRILSLVWIGYDDNASIGLTGSTGALPIWVHYMNRIAGMVPDTEFRRPDDVVDREVDPATGYLTTPLCPEKHFEIFVEGTEPTRLCPLHGGGDPDLFLDGDAEAWRLGREARASDRRGRLRRLLDRVFH